MTEHDSDVVEPLSVPFDWKALLHSSQEFAHACVDGFAVENAPFFYLHAGASVELGIKAALCRASPVLLFEARNRGSDRALIRLAGYQPVPDRLAKGTPREVFTVGFEAAIRRFELLHGPGALGVDEIAIQELKAARDVTAHGGAVGDADAVALLRILVTLARVHEALAPHLGLSASDFWGSRLGIVEKASRDQDDLLRSQVETLVAAANRRFQNEYGHLEEETLSAMMRETEERIQLGRDQGFRKCPVCGGTGVSTERAVKQTFVRPGGRRTLRGWTAIDFRCYVCWFHLPSEDMVEHADGFEALTEATGDLLEFWAEDLSGELDQEDFEALGYDVEELRILGLYNEP